jgi:hypothetical protein
MAALKRSPKLLGPVIESTDGGTGWLVRATTSAEVISVMALGVRFTPLALIGLGPFLLWIPFVNPGRFFFAVGVLAILVPPAIALNRSEELTIDDSGFTLRPLVGRSTSFRWSETYAVQVAGWWPSAGYTVYRFGIALIILAAPLLLEAPLWIGLPFAVIWIATPFAASNLSFSVAPHGTRFADPGPNVPIRKGMITLIGPESQQRVASLLLEAAEEHGVPAWSTWTKSVGTTPGIER